MGRRWLWVLAAGALALVAAMAAMPGSREPGGQEGPRLVQLRRDPVHEEGDRRAQEEHAQQVVEQINGVERAWVAVVDRTAYVGVELGPGVDQERAERIERTVTEQIVSRVDKIDQAFASTDPGVAGRIREISRELAAGRPESDYRAELEELAGRMKARMHTSNGR